jgi:sRNA-binding carbon storage regulator CsrA
MGFYLNARRAACCHLTRRIREHILVIDQDTGEQIVFAVLPHQKQGTGISIGIEASPRFQIFRRELLETKPAARTT